MQHQENCSINKFTVYYIARSAKAILCFAHVSAFSSVNSLRPSTDIVETFPHDVTRNVEGK